MGPETKGSLLAVGVESFIYGCCYTAMKTFIVLPEKASIFKRIGSMCIKNYISKRVAEDFVCEIDDTYSKVKAIAQAVKEEKEQEDGTN